MDGGFVRVVEDLALGDGFCAFAAVKSTTNHAGPGVRTLRAASRGGIGAARVRRRIMDVEAVLADEPTRHGRRRTALVFVG